MASHAESRDLRVDGRVSIPAAELSWTASRASGPGGQNVNKLATKVTLRFDLQSSSALSAAQKRRLAALAHGRLDAEGRLVVRAQAERSQRQNLQEARELLRKLVLRALEPPRPRVSTRPTRASKRRRLEAKRRIGDKKRARRKVEGRDD